METKHLHAGLCVRIERWLEANVCDAELAEELTQNTHQIAKRQVVISNQAFDLVELGQMCSIHLFVTIDTIDREEFDGCEHCLLHNQTQTNVSPRRCTLTDSLTTRTLRETERARERESLCFLSHT
jgi:hypothetical protein